MPRLDHGASVRAGASLAMSFHSALRQKVQAPALPNYAARDLTEGGDRATIVLDGQTHFLRITRAGKLIVTK